MVEKAPCCLKNLPTNSTCTPWGGNPRIDMTEGYIYGNIFW